MSATSTSTSPAATGLTRVVRYVLLGLLTLVLLVTGGAKVLMADFMMANMAEVHAGPVATVVIGVVELVAAAGLWLRRYRTLALAVFLLILAGATGVHWGFGHATGKVLAPAAIALLAFGALWLDRGRALWDFVLPARA